MGRILLTIGEACDCIVSAHGQIAAAAMFNPMGRADVLDWKRTHLSYEAGGYTP